LQTIKANNPFVSLRDLHRDMSAASDLIFLIVLLLLFSDGRWHISPSCDVTVWVSVWGSFFPTESNTRKIPNGYSDRYYKDIDIDALTISRCQQTYNFHDASVKIKKTLNPRHHFILNKQTQLCLIYKTDLISMRCSLYDEWTVVYFKRVIWQQCCKRNCGFYVKLTSTKCTDFVYSIYIFITTRIKICAYIIQKLKIESLWKKRK
jgi:hypothetical protein